MLLKRKNSKGRLNGAIQIHKIPCFKFMQILKSQYEKLQTLQKFIYLKYHTNGGFWAIFLFKDWIFFEP